MNKKVVYLVDSTILVEILNIHGKNANHETVLDDFKGKIKMGAYFFLPLATVIETGNHIAQSGNGHERRKSAGEFVKFINACLGGSAPFTPLSSDPEFLKEWTACFPEYPGREISFGDLSTIKDQERLSKTNRNIDYRIWTLDVMLDAHSSKY